MRIGGAVCKAIVSTLGDGFECDMWPYMSVTICTFMVICSMIKQQHLNA